jgi:hypothetical protein
MTPWRQANREQLNARRRAQLRAELARLRVVVFQHYGWTCACCGSSDRLTIDHVNGDGREHRKQIGTSSRHYYRWLVANGFPDGFQTLCLPCNNSKRSGDRCRLDHVTGSPGQAHQAALTIACPYCGAARGAGCRSTPGQHRMSPRDHADRRYLAAVAGWVSRAGAR